MQEFAIRELIPDTVELYGAFDVELRGDGASPFRLPSWTRPQLPMRTGIMARMPSGVRLRFRTDSSRLGLHFLATGFVIPPETVRPPISFTFEAAGEIARVTSDLGNTIVLGEQPGAFELRRGEPDTVWFDVPRGAGVCEIWLPHNAFVELRRVQIDDGAALSRVPSETRRRWIHYGSSISHCMEAEQPGETWPAIAARRANVALTSLGLAGECHLDAFVARTIRDSDADLISVKAGINVVNFDSMRDRAFAPALHGFIDTIRERKRDTPIAILSPIFCPAAEQTPGPMHRAPSGKFVTVPGLAQIREGCMTLERMREIMSEVVTTRRAQGDERLLYFDGRELFGKDDAGDLPDDLHPNPAGYVRMGERFAEKVLPALVAATPGTSTAR